MKKKIRLKADESLREYTNDDFLLELKQMQKNAKVETKKNKFQMNRWAYVACSLVVIISLTITGFSIFKQQDSAVKEYLNYNEEAEDIDFSVVESGLISITINQLDYIAINRKYDKIYGDTLYYQLNYENESSFEKINLIIVVNKDYSYESNFSSLELTAIVKNYTINYQETAVLEDGLYFFTNKGIIETINETIYIEYTGVSFENISPFLEALEGVIK